MIAGTLTSRHGLPCRRPQQLGGRGEHFNAQVFVDGERLWKGCRPMCLDDVYTPCCFRLQLVADSVWLAVDIIGFLMQ